LGAVSVVYEYVVAGAKAILVCLSLS
jgi:hypothetical protein